MKTGHLYINNSWVKGQGQIFSAINPADEAVIWQGQAANVADVEQAILTARKAFLPWSSLGFEKRLQYLEKYIKILERNQRAFAEILSKNTGKVLWETELEVKNMIQKLGISVSAYHERTGEKQEDTVLGKLHIRHRPHGVVTVFGPFNFPGHIPNGHILPALLAGNTIVFKPSELTPLVAEVLCSYFEEAELPAGVINLVQGGPETGKALSLHPEINGLYFTGSYEVGQKLLDNFSKHPEKILALEMGGNNPLFIHDIGENIEAAVYHTIQSAFASSGQRCTCARRLIVCSDRQNIKFIEKLQKTISDIQPGSYKMEPPAFMGPLISNQAAEHVQQAYQNLVNMGAKILVPLTQLGPTAAFLKPGLVDVSAIENREDREIFGPLLQLIWVKDFEAGIAESNRSQYGLVSGIFTEDQALYKRFYTEVKTGLINWNRALTGSSSHAPFGGQGKSGNHRPAAYYAADYCAYPVASLEANALVLPEKLNPGLTL